MAGQARLREALNAGGPGQKEKGPPVADGVLTVTPDTPEALEWRTRRSYMDSAGASSSYLEDDAGPRPASLYGKFTWKIENFSEISKRELRSTVFEVGNYKWYILVYPQGCDVCNHLSLFLCVADYDKLLPGWSHFSQFTIAVVNKDPKKSKYSDTLHRFCKKEHDWGWKKFMELSKVLEGFTVSNTLVIKAQVQVIRDRPTMPFRCLDAQYRRELVRVYLTNVETICRKFVDERRAALARLRDDSAGLRAFWSNLEPHQRQSLASERGDVLLKGLVKRFFNEKEVTSTLVMDALFSGCKQLEEMSRAADTRKGKKSKTGSNMVVSIDRNTFSLVGDVLALLERAAGETIQPHSGDKMADPLAARNAQEGDDSRDSAEREERRLAELGRRTVEVYSMAHIFSELEWMRLEIDDDLGDTKAAYCEAESIKRQDALIKEEEEAGKREDARSAARAASEREKKARKKERRRVKKVAEQDKQDKERQAQEQVDRQEADRKVQEADLRRRAVEENQRSQPQAQVPDATEPAQLTPTASSELTRAMEAAPRGAESRSTGRSPAGEEAGPSTSAADSLPSDVPPSQRPDSDDGLSSTDLTSSTLSMEDVPTASQLRERADGLAAEVDSLRAALARVTAEGNTARNELAAALTELQGSRAAVAARDEELSALRSRLASHSPPEQKSAPAGPAVGTAALPAPHPAAGPPVSSGAPADGACTVSTAGSDSQPTAAAPQDSPAAPGGRPSSAAPASQPAAPIARAASTSEPPPGFSRLLQQQQAQQPKENGAPQGHGGSNGATGATSNGTAAGHSARPRAWTGEPPESLGLGSTGPRAAPGQAARAGAAGKDAHSAAGPARGPAQLQRDGRSASGPTPGLATSRTGSVPEAQPGGLPKNAGSAPTMSRSKSKGLNGNAAAFVPAATGSASATPSAGYANGAPAGHAPQHQGAAPPPASQPAANGNLPHKAVLSYRNAAAGVLGSAGGKPHAGAPGQQQVQATSSPHPSQGSTDAGSTPPASPRGSSRMGGAQRSRAYAQSGFAQPGVPSTSPPAPAKRPEAPADSPGLDDFAHMGLITDLLD